MYLHLGLFDKYFKKRNEQVLLQEKIVSVIKKVTDITLNVKNVVQKNNTLFIHTHPILKSKIALKKEEIMDQLKKESITIDTIL